jgi:hypothetical protein
VPRHIPSNRFLVKIVVDRSSTTISAAVILTPAIPPGMNQRIPLAILITTIILIPVVLQRSKQFFFVYLNVNFANSGQNLVFKTSLQLLLENMYRGFPAHSDTSFYFPQYLSGGVTDFSQGLPK